MKKQLEELLDLYHSDLITKEEYETQRRKILESPLFDPDPIANLDETLPNEINNLMKSRQFNQAFALIQANRYDLSENQVLIWYTCIKYNLGALSEIADHPISSKILKKIKKDKTLQQIDLSSEPIFESFYQDLIFESNHSKPFKLAYKKVIVPLVILIIGLFSALFFGLFSFSTSVERINLSATQVTLRVGETIIVGANVSPADADFDGFIWKSEDTNIVTVNQTGLLTAVGAGSTSVTVEAGDQIGTINVTVQQPLADSNLNDSTDPSIEDPNFEDSGDVVPAPIRTAVSVAPVGEFDVIFGTPTTELLALLPAKTVVTDDQGDTFEVNLNWVLYEFNANNPALVPGRFLVSGLFTLPESVTRGSIRTQVDTFVNLKLGLVSIIAVPGFRVGFGASVTEAAAGLPSTVRITDSLGDRYNATVTWTSPENYDSKAINSSFNFVGAVELPAGIIASPQVPARVTVPVTINQTALPVSSYRWTSSGDAARIIAGEPQTITIRIQTLALGLEGAGAAVLNFGLSDDFVAPGVQDVSFVVNGITFKNYGSINVNLARSTDLTIEIKIQVENPDEAIKLSFVLSKANLTLDYEFDVIKND